MSISQNFPAITPSLNLNFARSKKLDPRITFTRSSRATRTNAQGLIEVVGTDTPRFEHSVVGVGSTVTSIQSLGLLIEESRTNLITYSAYNASTWSNIFPANTTLTTGISAPDGTNTAIRLTCTATGNSLLRIGFPPFTPNGTDTYTVSFYVRLISGNTSNSGQLTTDLADETPSGDYLPNLITNQWVRVSFSGVPTAVSKSFLDLLSDNTNNYVLDFWGAQLEVGAFPTSYIPTVASTGTRSGDLAFIDLPSTGWYNYSQGSLIFQHSTVPYATGTSPGYPAIGFAQTNGSSTNSIQYFFDKSTGLSQYLVRDAGADQATISVSTGAPAAKVGFAYTTNSFVLARNGSQVGTDASGTVPQSIGTLLLGTNNKAVANNLNASISNVIYYPRALSSSQLQNLTK